MQNLINKYIEISSEEEMDKASKWLELLGYKNIYPRLEIKKNNNKYYLFIAFNKSFHFNIITSGISLNPFSVLYDNGMPREEEDLVSKAKRLYPIGTQYKCAAGDYEVHTVESMDWAPSPSDTVYGEDGKGCIYKHGKWAEIVHEVKPIEKWRVGSYVVFFNNSTLHNLKLGTIDKVKYNLDKDGDSYFVDYGCCSRSRLDVDVKWFATLEEAEKFAATIKEPVPECIEWKPKVGDWVVTDNLSNGNGGMYDGNLGQVWQIGSIHSNWYSPVESMKFPGGSLELHNLRKATPSEIDFVNYVGKKEELLEQAKKKYPKNTIVKKMTKPGKGTIEDNYRFDGEKDIVVDTSNGCVYLYKDGKWAEIIETPKTEEYNRGNIGSNISSITYSYTRHTESPKETHQSSNKRSKFSPIKAELIKVKQLKIKK